MKRTAIQNRQKRTSGFSLIEVLVATAIFSVVVAIIGGTYAQMLDLQRRGFGIQKVQENALFVLELMAREIRVSTITDQDADCNPSGNNTLTIDHPVNGIVTYTLLNGAVHRQPDVQKTAAPPLSSDEVNFVNLNFCVFGSSVSDDRQVRVAIVAVVESRGQARNKTLVNLQTMVASRDVVSEE